MNVLAGFKFKPSHRDVHYLCTDEETGESTFSKDIEHANRYGSEQEATRAIYLAIADFTEDDDYEWTPVLTNENGAEIGNIRPFFRVGTPQFEEHDLPHFISLEEQTKG